MGVQGFGKPKYGASGREWETFKLVISKTDDMQDNIFRFIPPIHDCADAGIWQVYTATHYSYGGVNPADTSKPKIRPFRCIEDKDMRTKMIKVSCPECEEAYRLKAQLEEQRAALAAGGMSEKDIKVKTAALEKAARSHEPTRKWNSWAIGVDGKIGLVPYSHTLKKKLDELRKKLDKKQIDMLDPDSGVFINFRRKGNPPNLQEEVEAVTEQVPFEGEMVDRIKRAPLTQEQANTILSTLEKYDLRQQGGTVLTAQQISMLVACGGDPEEVDRIFGLSQPAKAAPASTPAPASQPVTPPAPLAAPVIPPTASAPAASSVTPPPAAPTPVTPPPALGADATNMAALQAQMAALQAQLAAAKATQAATQVPATAAPAPATTPPANVAPAAAPAAAEAPAVAPAAPATTGAPVGVTVPAGTSEMSNADFLKLFP